MITQQQIDEAFEARSNYEDEIIFHNNAILRMYGVDDKTFRKVMDGAYEKDKIAIVKEPQGESQNESFGVVKKVYVDQWDLGMNGDSFQGFVYAQIKENEWLRIPFEC